MNRINACFEAEKIELADSGMTLPGKGKMEMNDLSTRHPKAGFTLVELMIVVLILGILATVALPQVIAPSLAAKESALKADLVAFRKAIELYKIQHNETLPQKNEKDVVDQLTGKTDKDGNAGNDFGPYLRKIPRNPINNDDSIKIQKLPKAPNDSSGWYYDKDTGEIRANASGAGPSGVNYVDL
ncbi:MAG: type II secretion system protein [Planctomycetota bacterium]